MKIELFMKSIHQEFSDTFNESQILNWSNNQWPYEHWPTDYWALNYSMVQFSKPIGDQLSHVLLRNERFGGLLYDRATKAIFKVDHEAFDILSILKQGIKIDALNQYITVNNDDIKYLKDSLKRFKICTL